MLTPPKFKSLNEEQFFKTLRQRVNEYFKAKNETTFANTEMFIKAFLTISLWAGAYLFLIFGGFSTPVNYGLWALIGLSIPIVAVNVGHDAIHGSFSNKAWVNKLLSHTFNLNGASAYMWTKMHNVAHHTYTNIHGLDEDIESLPVIRLSPGTPWKKVHRYQHIYAFLFYGLATFSWVFIKDYIKFFKNDVGNYNNKPHPTAEYFWLFFYKALNYTIYIVIPFMLIQAPWQHILGGFLLMHFVAGFYLAMVFMLAHVVEETHFPVPDISGTLENSWAIHQLYTTANFSRPSRLAGYLTGGLNLQVEHHLFPNMCSIHYRSISQIVKDTATDFGIPYYESPSFFKAVQSHVRFLKKIGSQAEYVTDMSKINDKSATAIVA